MNRFNTISLFFISLFVFGKCTEDKVKCPEAVIVCYLDFSETPDWNQRMNGMKELVMDKIIDTLPFRCKFVVLPIDKASLTSATEIFVGSIKKKNDYIPDNAGTLEEESIAQSNVKADKDKMKKDFSAAFDAAVKSRKNLQKGTDIFGALNQASRYSCGESSPLVILLSDMMNYTADVKMEEGALLQASLKDAFKKTTQNTLTKAKLLIFTGDVSYIGQEHFISVRGFWQQYFTKTNNELIDYSSGGISLFQKTISTFK